MQWQTMLLIATVILPTIFLVGTVFLIGISYGFGTIEHTAAVMWLIGVVLILSIPSESSASSNPLTFEVRGWRPWWLDPRY